MREAMAIRERLAAHDARFISLNDLLKVIAEAEGVTVHQAALALWRYAVLDDVQPYLLDIVFFEYTKGGTAAFRNSLSIAALQGVLSGWALEAAEQLEDNEVGFMKDEVVVALAKAKIAVPESLVEEVRSIARVCNATLEDEATAVEVDPTDELGRARARIGELELERAELLAKIEQGAMATDAATINSPTLNRILEAVGQYPAWRVAQSQEPNLKAVLGWQQKQQEGKGNASRVAHVAHHVIAEHFGLKS